MSRDKAAWVAEISLLLSQGFSASASSPLAWVSANAAGARGGRAPPSPAAAFHAHLEYKGMALSSIRHSWSGTSSLWNSPSGGGGPRLGQTTGPHPQELQTTVQCDQEATSTPLVCSTPIPWRDYHACTLKGGKDTAGAIGGGTGRRLKQYVQQGKMGGIVTVVAVISSGRAASAFTTFQVSVMRLP